MSVALITGLGVVTLIGAIALKQRSDAKATTKETRESEDKKDRDDA